jgi:4-hydroxyphenylacetate 3-monooxygenase
MDIPYQLEKTAAKSTPAHLRSGSQFLEDLRRRERSVFLHGERIEDPASHPAFSAAARSIARLYDFASLPENRDVMTFSNPESTSPVLRCYQIPKSAGDLHLKRLAAERWAELSLFGFMGRTPDHVANFLSGFAAKPSIFAEAGRQYAENIVSFYEFMRDNHLFAAYAIVPPQIDRSKPPHAQQDPRLYAGVIKETDAGIVLAGGQQLATAGVFADFLLLSCIHPLQRGDENYAISVALPIDTPGLKLYSRRAFTLMASDSTEYPLTTRFDESDCFVILDNAFVPWERVFVYRNIELCRDQWFKTPAHLYGNAQAQTRFAVKLRFFAGLANRLNREIGHASNPAVQMRMGELLSWAAVVEGMLDAQVANATIDDQGVVWPSKTALYSLMALQSEIAPRVVEIIRELSGAVMITLPSSTEDFDSEHTSADVRRYFASADFDARSKVRLMWLIWDSIGSEFASRSLQYEIRRSAASYQTEPASVL